MRPRGRRSGRLSGDRPVFGEIAIHARPKVDAERMALGWVAPILSFFNVRRVNAWHCVEYQFMLSFSKSVQEHLLSASLRDNAALRMSAGKRTAAFGGGFEEAEVSARNWVSPPGMAEFIEFQQELVGTFFQSLLVACFLIFL